MPRRLCSIGPKHQSNPLRPRRRCPRPRKYRARRVAMSKPVQRRIHPSEPPTARISHTRGRGGSVNGGLMPQHPCRGSRARRRPHRNHAISRYAVVASARSIPQAVPISPTAAARGRSATSGAPSEAARSRGQQQRRGTVTCLWKFTYQEPVEGALHVELY